MVGPGEEVDDGGVEAGADWLAGPWPADADGMDSDGDGLALDTPHAPGMPGPLRH